MDHNFIVTGNKFDFEIKPNPANWELAMLCPFEITTRNGRIYITSERFGTGKAVPVKKSHFYQRVFNYWDEPSEKEMMHHTFSQLVAAVNANYEFLRQVYQDIYWNIKDKYRVCHEE